MSAPVQPPDTVTARAARTAETVAEQAGVSVRMLDTLADVKEAANLLASVWQTAPSLPPLNPDLMRALAHTGNYVAGAYSGDALLGVSVGFLSGNGTRHLHSHVSGVAQAVQGRSVGYALKLHQRAWALSHGITEVSWTVDPLVRRNIFFNLVKLRATVVGYLPNFYGAMADGVNAGDDSDRLMLSWYLTDERVDEPAHDAAGARVNPAVPVLVDVTAEGGPELRGSAAELRVFTCRLPQDIVALRARRPELAHAWRAAVRQTLGSALRDGARVAGFSREGGYVVAL
jgi:predicted GNAT superfamily acetyltransferase